MTNHIALLSLKLSIRCVAIDRPFTGEVGITMSHPLYRLLRGRLRACARSNAELMHDLMEPVEYSLRLPIKNNLGVV